VSKSSLHLFHLFHVSEALGYGQAQPVEQHLLGVVRRGHAADADGLAWSAIGRAGGKDHVTALDLGELLDDGSRGIAEAGAAHPLGQCLPEHVRKEADQDMSLDPLGLLMPDGPDLQFVLVDTEGPQLGPPVSTRPRQFVLVDTEGPLRFGQLDVPLPQPGGVRSRRATRMLAALYHFHSRVGFVSVRLVRSR